MPKEIFSAISFGPSQFRHLLSSDGNTNRRKKGTNLCGINSFPTMNESRNDDGIENELEY